MAFDSGDNTTRGLNALPPELLLSITELLGRNDLRNLRLVSRKVTPAATTVLFRTISITTDRFGVPELPIRHVKHDLELAKLVQQLRFDTVESGLWRHPPNGIVLTRNAVFQSVRNTSSFLNFPNVKKLTICASNASNESGYPDVFVLPFFLATLFSELRHQQPEITLESLHIHNLVHDVSRYSLWKASSAHMLRNLKDLRLHLWSRPSREFETRKTMALLPKVWLLPCRNQLRHLSLSCNVHFGYLPKFDLRGVHFPCLKTLALRRYIFSDEWQLNWLLSHSDTLAELYIADSGILSLTISNLLLDDEFYPKYSLYDVLTSSETTCTVWDLSWENLFEKIESVMSLQHFVFGEVVGNAGPYEESWETLIQTTWESVSYLTVTDQLMGRFDKHYRPWPRKDIKDPFPDWEGRRKDDREALKELVEEAEGCPVEWVEDPLLYQKVLRRARTLDLALPSTRDSKETDGSRA
ncbi:uncharacterized protein BDZ99DRAFT_567242 [Mytilinidion resinicola]|uniref:F-box domain-containing protein n=1 Tax=Mytilinidion resinicola TaxID=574789 RepID=A0A6A6Z421_9PEZI|nr:uncharacterized protein BDZ99DRAFT_567242 [Mytilinidion resinicola]KAF2815393.1 hypothetical protein BDZ99DRAFT_567242 [Mytilinidion resinicola]